MAIFCDSLVAYLNSNTRAGCDFQGLSGFYGNHKVLPPPLGPSPPSILRPDHSGTSPGKTSLSNT